MEKDIDNLLKYINFDGKPESWYNLAHDIDTSYNLNWLDNYDFEKIIEFYAFDKSFKARIYQELDLLKRDNKLNYICYIMYYILYYADVKNYYNIWSWKSTSNTFKDHGSYMIPVVSLLCGYEFHIKNMSLRCFDEKQIKAQKYNINLTCTSDRKRHNIDGIRFSQMIWGSFFMKGNIIQIGRLQYEIGVKNFSKLDKYFDTKKEYVYIHIPKDKDLNKTDVEESIKNSRYYIKKYYPNLDTEKLIYYTQSWLLSPEVKEILPNSSNIVKFQNMFNIIEYEECINDFLNFVFDEVINDIKYEDLVENTLLQKKLKQYLLEGRKLHLGLGILKNI